MQKHVNSVPQTAATCRKWSRLLAMHSYGRWGMGLWLPHWDGTNSVTMEDAVVTSWKPVKNQDNADRCLWCCGFGALRLSCQTPGHETDHLQKGMLCKAFEIKFVGTAPQMLFRILFLHNQNAPCPNGKAQCSSGSAAAVLTRFGPLLLTRLKIALKRRRFQDVAEIQLNTTRRLQTISKHAVKSGKIARIVTYDVKDRTSKEATQSIFNVPQLSHNKFFPRSFSPALVCTCLF